MHHIFGSPLIPNAGIRIDHNGCFGLTTPGNDQIVCQDETRSDEQIGKQQQV